MTRGAYRQRVSGAACCYCDKIVQLFAEFSSIGGILVLQNTDKHTDIN